MSESYKAPRFELAPRGISHKVGWLMWQGIQSRLEIRFDDQDQENYAALDNHLEGSSAITFGYHPEEIEAVIAPIVSRAVLSNLDRAVVPLAAYIYHKPAVNALSKVNSSLLRVHYMPVVRTDNPKDAPHAKHQEKYRRQLMTTTNNGLARPGFVYGIVPAGTRETSLSDKVNTSFIKINARHDYQVPYFPLAIYKEDEAIRIRAGKLVFLQELATVEGNRNEIAAAYAPQVMQALADLLPEENRGPYR